MPLNEKLIKLLKESNINLDDKTDLKDFFENLSKYLDQRDKEDEEVKGDLRRYSAVIDTTPSTISWINNKCEYIKINKAMSEVLPMPVEDYLGKTVGFHSKDDSFTNFARDLFSQAETVLYRELPSILKTEQKKYYWVVGSQYDKGKEAVIIGIDVTEFKTLQDQAQSNEKMAVIGVMAAGMAHEIKNPLAIIKNSAEILKMKVDKGGLNKEKLLETLEKIDKNSDRITKIVKGLQSFSRQSEADPYVKTPLFPIVEDSVALCIDKLKRLDIEINIDKFPKNLEAICRGGEITQVIVNFINNASDAIETLEMKWIRIEGEVINNMVKISIIDSGGGIPQEIKNKIFEAFFTTKPLGKGTGLGLSICKGIIENHKGNLDIESHAPNTTFTFTLPIVQYVNYLL